VTDSLITSIGAACFGIVIGYITYRALARTTSSAPISDLAAVIGAVGGGVVTGLFAPGTTLFGWYAIGLLLGMILYPLIFFRLAGRELTTRILGPDADPRPR
jgi:hypothetical protein